MILKIALAQPMFNNYRHDPQSFKNESQSQSQNQKRTPISFASVLKNEIYANTLNKNS